MWKDEIVQEVRRVRDAQARRFDYDIDRITEAARDRQHRSGRRVVSFAGRKKARLHTPATPAP